LNFVAEAGLYNAAGGETAPSAFMEGTIRLHDDPVIVEVGKNASMPSLG
jgi:hypothetical protein